MYFMGLENKGILALLEAFRLLKNYRITKNCPKRRKFSRIGGII